MNNNVTNLIQNGEKINKELRIMLDKNDINNYRKNLEDAVEITIDDITDDEVDIDSFGQPVSEDDDSLADNEDADVYDKAEENPIINGKGTSVNLTSEKSKMTETNSTDNEDDEPEEKPIIEDQETSVNLTRVRLTKKPQSTSKASKHCKSLYKCKQCSYSGTIAKKFEYHMQLHMDGVSKNYCKDCDYLFNNNLEYKKHMKKMHGRDIGLTNQNRFKCSKCPYKSKNRSHVLRHEETHDREGSHRCLHCNQTFKNLYFLGDHLRIKHAGRLPFVCSKCDMEYSLKINLDNHLLLQHSYDIENVEQYISNKIHRCEVCSYKTCKTDYLKVHTLHKHSENPDAENFSCHICGYTTRYKSALKTHINDQHVKINTFTCQFCQKEFAKKVNLHNHMVVSHQKNLDENLRKTIPFSISKCNKCKFECILVDVFRNHMYRKHGIVNDKIYKCKSCDYVTENKSVFKSHMYTHAKVKPHVCSRCGDGFPQKNLLFNHIVQNHAEDKELMNTITHKIHVCRYCEKFMSTFCAKTVKNHEKKCKDKISMV